MDAQNSREAPVIDEGPDDAGKFSLNEDWLATIVGLLLLGVCLLGWITKSMLVVG